MKWGTVIWFSDNSNPFLVDEEYCDNAECDCNEVALKLREISESGHAVKQAKSLSLRVDLGTWEECDPPERTLQSAKWVRQFLDEFPADRRAEIKARFDKRKQTDRRIATFTIDPADVTAGILFPFADLLSDKGALTSGGRSYTYSFVSQNREYLVEDLYCPNPACDCREFSLQFWARGSLTQDGIETVTIAPVFLGKVKFTGQQRVISRQEVSPAEAEALLTVWRDRYGDDLAMLKGRYQEVKEVGQRSLDAAMKSRVIPALEVASEYLPNDFALARRKEGPVAVRKQVGRNDLCPCGSGVKYKKCCGRR